MNKPPWEYHTAWEVWVVKYSKFPSFKCYRGRASLYGKRILPGEHLHSFWNEYMQHEKQEGKDCSWYCRERQTHVVLENKWWPALVTKPAVKVFTLLCHVVRMKLLSCRHTTQSVLPSCSCFECLQHGRPHRTFTFQVINSRALNTSDNLLFYKIIVLDNFVSTWHELESSRKREPHLGKCLQRIRLYGGL